MRRSGARSAEQARQEMVERQLRHRGIRDERVLAAMGRVPRELFVPQDTRRHAYDDAALLIPCGQTISQPYIVAATCELLALQGTEHVLEVGTGSGYAAAVLAELASSVVSIERIPELAELARHALAEAGYDRVSVIVGDGSRGLPEQAPFDAIAVAAAAPHVPERLVAQLRVGGRLVLPLGSRRAQMLTVVERTPAGSSLRAVVPCRFVPLVGDEGFRPADVG